MSDTGSCRTIHGTTGVRIDGTRITVHRIAVLYIQGQNAEDIAQCYPYLTLSQIYTGLAYFHANHAEIESELTALDADYDELKQPACLRRIPRTCCLVDFRKLGPERAFVVVPGKSSAVTKHEPRPAEHSPPLPSADRRNSTARQE